MISVTLRGNTTDDLFKGFVIQPLVYKGTTQGKRSNIAFYLQLNQDETRSIFIATETCLMRNCSTRKCLFLVFGCS